jgi:hypothetical protein
MMFGWRRTTLVAMGMALVCWLGIVSAASQAGTEPAPQMSEGVFKNIQVLKGIPVDEFMDTMGMFASSLGYDCTSCHDPGIRTNREAFATQTPSIQRARQMILMMNGINRANFSGEQRVSCFTCHRGHYRPEVVPDFRLQYGGIFDDPNAMILSPDRRATADQIFTKYVQALGGAQRLAGLTSYTAKGTYAGFNTGGAEAQIEIYAKAPDQRSMVVHVPDGDWFETFDGKNAWVTGDWRPVPLLPLTGGNLVGARLDATVAFPAGIRGAFSQWQVSSTTIDDRPVQILQGSNAGQLPVNFYFDEAGLLVRLVRWNKTAVGTVPVQVDYSDYRDVAGVKVPFRSVVTWTDGQNTIALSQVQPNVAIDAARFARPAPYQRRNNR